MGHIERSIPFVTVVPNDNVSVPFVNAALFGTFVYAGARVYLGIRVEICQQ